MRVLFLLIVADLLGSCFTKNQVIVGGERPGLTYSIDKDKAERSANFLAYGKNAKICPDLSAKANLILGYWITRQFRNTLSWQVAHNNAKGAYVFLEDDDLAIVSQVKIMNPMALVDSCTYTLPLDSIGYLEDFADTYTRIGVGYAKIRYGVPRNDS